MIEPEELRLGNVLKISGFVDAMTVSSINHNDIQLKTFPDYHEYDADFEEVEPIQLTEQILLKCGFEPIDYSSHIQYGHNDFWQLTYYKDAKIYRFEDIEMTCKYLHQLQNLYFALTGEGLTINL